MYPYVTQIQVHSLQILQDLSVKELWSSRVLAHPQILSIVKVKCKYQSLNKLESISSVRFYQAVMYFDWFKQAWISLVARINM